MNAPTIVTDRRLDVNYCIEAGPEPQPYPLPQPSPVIGDAQRIIEERKGPWVTS